MNMRFLKFAPADIDASITIVCAEFRGENRNASKIYCYVSRCAVIITHKEGTKGGAKRGEETSFTRRERESRVPAGDSGRFAIVFLISRRKESFAA